MCPAIVLLPRRRLPSVQFPRLSLSPAASLQENAEPAILKGVFRLRPVPEYSQRLVFDRSLARGSF